MCYIRLHFIPDFSSQEVLQVFMYDVYVLYKYAGVQSMIIDVKGKQSLAQAICSEPWP